MPKGTIKKINSERGFGFINKGVARDDIFFHATGCNGQFDDLQEGQDVLFDVDESDKQKGPRAINVRPT